MLCIRIDLCEYRFLLCVNVGLCCVLCAKSWFLFCVMCEIRVLLCAMCDSRFLLCVIINLCCVVCVNVDLGVCFL